MESSRQMHLTVIIAGGLTNTANFDKLDIIANIIECWAGKYAYLFVLNKN